MSSKEELDKILLNPDYAESLGIKVYVRVEDNGDKYVVLNNGEEEIEYELPGRPNVRHTNIHTIFMVKIKQRR